MRNLFLTITLTIALCAPVPARAQQNPPATAPSPNAPAPQAPTLEKPGMAEPEPEPAKPAVKTPPLKPAAKPATKPGVDPSSGATVEEIIARVNNEIITKSEYDKSLTAAA